MKELLLATALFPQVDQCADINQMAAQFNQLEQQGIIQDVDPEIQKLYDVQKRIFRSPNKKQLQQIRETAHSFAVKLLDTGIGIEDGKYILREVSLAVSKCVAADIREA